MSLSCERLGLGPNGPLSTAEKRVYKRYAWTSPQAALSPMRYVCDTIFHTKSIGLRSVAEFPEPTTPMDIDSAPSNADTSDIDMIDAPAVRRVAFTPPPDYGRPSFGQTAMPRTALSQRIHLINETEKYVPKEPYPLNHDVEYSHPSLHDLSSAGRTPPGKPLRATNHFSPPDDSSFSDLSPQDASTPLPFSPRGPSSWRIAPAKTGPQRLSPQGRSILTPVSPRVATSPPNRTLSPQTLYPSLQSTRGRKRAYCDALETDQEPTVQPRTVRGMFFGLVRSLTSKIYNTIWSLFTPRATCEQEVAGVHTLEGNKRRCVAVQAVESGPIPGYYPGLDKGLKHIITPLDIIKVPNTTTLATPPDSRSSSMEKSSPPPLGMTQQSHGAIDVIRLRKQTGAQLMPPEPRVACMMKSSQPSTGVIQQSQCVTGTSQLREQTQSAGTETTFLPHSSTSKQYHGTVETSASCTQTIVQPSKPRWKTANYSGAARYIPVSQRPAYVNAMRVQQDRAEREREANQRVEALVKKAKDITIDSPQEKALKESIRTRKHRLVEQEDLKEKEARAKEAKEEARLKAEREAEEAREKAEEERKLAEEAAKVAAADAARRQETIENFLPSISEEWRKNIATRLATTDPTKELANSTRGTPLTRRTFGCILPQADEYRINIALGSDIRKGPSGWLNDEGVDGFIGAIVDRKREQQGYVKGKGTPAFAAFGCQWYTNVKKGGMKSISRWARRQQIGAEKLLECEKIFFPVNTGAHWVLLIISPKDKTLEFLDSAGGSGRNFFKVGREWLAMELGSKYDEEAWIELGSRSQPQLNMDDCGVFTCMNALASAKGVDFAAVRPVRDMKKAREYITSVLLDGGFGKDFEL